ncbi:MAG: hypothetical protein LBL91_05250 [Lachnospiraceae bacterium]|jgi:hypothetical protein|nr:hypothetical protein [Lachnospiraceae bacterium]
MAIVTFWSNNKKQTYQTASMAAIATSLVVNHNFKTLLLSTEPKDTSLVDAFIDTSRDDFIKGIMGNKIDMAAGLDGLVKLYTTNKLNPESITDYARIILKGNRLEILPAPEEEPEQPEIALAAYKDVLLTAEKFYNIVFVDLSKGLDNDMSKQILEMSDLVVLTITQGIREINSFIEARESNPVLMSDKIILSIGRYDNYSKYTVKNVARALGNKILPYTIPYNTLFFEAFNEGKLLDFFIKFANSTLPNSNTSFMTDVKTTKDALMQKLADVR